jgi:segregation and condensation protein B
MSSLIGQIEAILFVASKPLSYTVIAKATDRSVDDVQDSVHQLQLKHSGDNNGIRIFCTDADVQMGTAPELSAVVDSFVKDETVSDLTKAQLETLTVIAYRGPITRPELEQVRGVNCALILRNLLIRGLIVEDDTVNHLAVSYRLSLDALRHLGINSLAELPEYETLHVHEYIETALGKMSNSTGEETE